MINSKSKKLKKIVVPIYSEDKELTMLPINLEGNNVLPKEFKKYKQTVKDMIKNSPVKKGIAYLTIHEKLIKPNKTHRRPGAHIDGNFILQISDKGFNKGGGGWKIGENGPAVTTDFHKRAYCVNTGGMLIISTHSLCKGWNGKFKGTSGVGGDCSGIPLNKGFMLKPNRVYLTNSQFIHESVPTDKEIKRVLIRITLPETSYVLNN